MGDLVEFKNYLYKNKQPFMLAFNQDEAVVNKYLLGVYNTIVNNQTLLKCTPESIRDAAITSAVLDVPIDARQYAYLVPYKEKAQFQLSYKGYIHIAKRDPDVDNIISAVVYKGDSFSFDIAQNTITHMPNLDDAGYGHKDNIKFFYAIVRFKANTGRAQMFEVITRKQVDDIRASSSAGGETDKWGNPTIWAKHYIEMGRKTNIKRLCKHAQLGDVAVYDQIDNSIESGKIINVTPDGELQVKSDDLELKNKIIEDVEACATEEELREVQKKHQDSVMEFSMYNIGYSKEINTAMGKKDDTLYIAKLEDTFEACEDVESIDKVFQAHTVRINRLKAKERNALEKVYCECKEALLEQSIPS